MLYANSVFHPKWKYSGPEATIGWDVSGYYMYLPAIFIYKDIKQLGFKDDIMEKYRPTYEFYQAKVHWSGNYIMRYSMGQAILYAPWFGLGHLGAYLFGFEPDGFSVPYQFALHLGLLMYAFIGLWALRKLLLKFFTDTATALSLIAIVFATNYLEYSAISVGLPHNTLFTIYVLLILTTIAFYEKPSTKLALVIGGLCGIATIVRPSEIVSILIPLMWGVFSIDSIKERIGYLIRNKKYVVVISLMVVLIGSFQMIYWKYTGSEWIIYSYPKELAFDWLHPHLIAGIFSYRSGWLVYSPVMLASIIGFIYLFRDQRHIFLTAFVFMGLFIYVCFAWSNWWYGGGIGIRAMIQSYPILALPMTAFFSSILKKGNVIKLTFSLVLAVFIYYNLWLIYQAHDGGLLKVGQMTKSYFWATVGRFEVDEKTLKLLDTDEAYHANPENPRLLFSDANTRFVLDKEQPRSQIYSIPADNNLRNWIRASADFECTTKEWDMWTMTQFIVTLRSKGEIVKEKFIRVHRMLPDGSKKNIYIDLQVPAEQLDSIQVSFRNPGHKPIFIENLKVVTFD